MLVTATSDWTPAFLLNKSEARHGFLERCALAITLDLLAIFLINHFVDTHIPTGSLGRNLLHVSHMCIALWPAISYVYHDYAAFLALGPGGTPSTFNGYLWVTFLKLVYARSNPLEPPTFKPYEQPGRHYLRHLPLRSGERPKVRGIAPQRQVTQKGSDKICTALSNAMANLYATNAHLLNHAKSYFEKHNLALFFAPRIKQHTCKTKRSLVGQRLVKVPVIPKAKSYLNRPDPLHAIWGKPAEIMHMHKIDSSMHLTLHPSDAAIVIRQGWGEMHPLAGQGPWVPRGFCMIYAPRDEKDIRVIMRIVRAAAWWVGGCFLRPEPKIRREVWNKTIQPYTGREGNEWEEIPAVDEDSGNMTLSVPQVVSALIDRPVDDDCSSSDDDIQSRYVLVLYNHEYSGFDIWKKCLIRHKRW